MKFPCFCVMIDSLYLNKFKFSIDVISEPDRRNKILFSRVMKIDFSRSTMKPVGVSGKELLDLRGKAKF